ncbi:MAG: cupin domain-containing protein [Bdellovibrionales bacterium]
MKRPSCIGNYKEFQDPDNSHYEGSDELLSIGAPIGKKLGLTAIGIHIETLSPGRRTSWPHAESAEEEFAYVIEGNPHVWIDGIIHELKPGDFVAFPAGSGIAHTFVNNTDKTCVLMVGGEANKPHNKVFYPLHPKRNDHCREKGTFWEGHPQHALGGHDGLPDKQR